MAGKCLLVTGPPGVGKTTTIVKCFERLMAFNSTFKLQGFYTREIRENGQRVGFRVETLDSRTALLATTHPLRESSNWPRVGRFKVDVASFESLALPELQVREDTDLFIIDEVGKMESFSKSFSTAILNILESNIPIFATVPIQDNIPAVARLKSHPGATIYTLDTSNRHTMKDRIFIDLLDVLSQK